MTEPDDHLPLLAASAYRLFEKHGEISVSRLQRAFLMRYSRALQIVAYLEQNGCVSHPDQSGTRTLLPDEKIMQQCFSDDALRKFVGCDSDEHAAGTPASPSVWLFGIEHGTYRSRHDGGIGVVGDANDDDNDYSVETQRRWPYNQKAFKLLAAMQGIPVQDWREYAEKHQPFVKGSPGYFKGNLYPYACHNAAEWPAEAADETGFANKLDYQTWCRDKRLPVIRSWVEEYKPSVFIGVGSGYRNDFSRAVFANEAELETTVVVAAGKERRLFFRIDEAKKLVVVPHFSSAAGLNSDALLQATGTFIAKLMNG